MRFVPLIRSSSAPENWAPFRSVELKWDGHLHADWEISARGGLAIHALHLPPKPWGDELLETALEALHPRLGADFLVIPSGAPTGRQASSAILQALEALLERTSGQGVKLALRPSKGALPGLRALLKEARGEAVGFCWDPETGLDLDLISDRLYTAVGGAEDDYTALQRTGYRWNLAMEGNARELPSIIKALEDKYPTVFFPAEMPTTALGRPIVPDESLIFGAHWNAQPRQERRVSGTLLVIAGEASGDLHGAKLLSEIKARRPTLRIIGIGGDGMAPYLDRQLAHVKDLGVVGFIEVIKHLPSLNRLFKQILLVAREENIDAALFIDYPGLNLRLAKSLRSSMPAVKLHQYVCPQVWAWKKGRIPELGRILDTLYCLFDFEPVLFKGLPVEAIWVGNQLVEMVKPELDRGTFFSSTGLDPSKPMVALLPGSRMGEIQRLLPPLAELARRWRQDPIHREVQWVLPVAPTLSDEFIKPFLDGTPILPLRSYSYAARAYADAALVASGTATLETALLGTPFAIVYKLNPLTYFMAKSFVKLPYFGLANVVAGRGVVEELVQGQVNPDALSMVLVRLLDPASATRIREGLGTVRQHLGEPGAAARVAEHLLNSMEKS